jgi:hypothetical protein
MELSLSVTYFLNQIKDENDKKFFIQYYDNYLIHLDNVKKHIEIKKSLQLIIKNMITTLNNKLTEIDYNYSINDELKLKLSNELILYNNINNDITNSLELIEIDARNYKENFKKNLFYLIKK